MDRVTSDYLASMEAFHNFFEMLHDAMLVSLPRALLSKTGAFVWRGYRVDDYRELAQSQYYCLVRAWTGTDPNVLLFTESYLHKGRYHFPFERSFDLVSTGFLQLDKAEQKSRLVEFVSGAATDALDWQKSSERVQVVPPELLKGKRCGRNPKDSVTRYDRVAREPANVYKAQDTLFRMLGESIQSVLAQERVVLRPNSQWRNWDFRGYRMRLHPPEGSKPGGPIPYRWVIYYDIPSVIFLQHYDGQTVERIASLELKRTSFFDLEGDEQFEVIRSFAQEGLRTIGVGPLH